jgi:ubiquinol-cytochrome c reductase cytochrome b subunit
MLEMTNMGVFAPVTLGIIRDHVFAYPVPSNISYLWCMGLTLMIIFVLRIITGVCLVSEPMMGVGSILFHMIMSNMGRIAPGLHAIGSTMVMAVLFMHMLR